MDLRLPFGDETLRTMDGRTVALAENHRNENLFSKVRELSVRGGGDCEKGWGFETLDGALRLMRDSGAGSRSCLCEFRGLECRGGTVYAVGHRLDEEAKHGFSRTVLYEKMTLRPEDCGVCVSSHVDYESTTLEPLLKSLRKTGFDMGKVLAVVDGDPRWRAWDGSMSDGARIARANVDAMGFAGLTAAYEKSGPEYWFLVHDTCEFERDFVEKLSKVDVGMGPDVVLLAQGSEMGFYRSSFVAECGVSLLETRPAGLLPALMRRARVVTVAEGKVEHLGEKDVYGTGSKRKVNRIASVGVRKFVGRDARGGRP